LQATVQLHVRPYLFNPPHAAPSTAFDRLCASVAPLPRRVMRAPSLGACREIASHVPRLSYTRCKCQTALCCTRTAVLDLILTTGRQTVYQTPWPRVTAARLHPFAFIQKEFLVSSLCDCSRSY
jgi:hypothetical protein